MLTCFPASLGLGTRQGGEAKPSQTPKKGGFSCCLIPEEFFSYGQSNTYILAIADDVYPIFYESPQHIEVDYFSGQERLLDNNIEASYVKNADQLADFLEV